MNSEFVENIRFSGDGASVVILDQTLLPNEIKYIELRERRELYDAIKSLRIRGAPAIGIFAAFALYVLALQTEAGDYDSFRDEILKHSAYLDSARPTAVNLSKQLRRMEGVVENHAGQPIPLILDVMRSEAEKIQREDVEMCSAIAECGQSLLLTGANSLSLSFPSDSNARTKSAKTAGFGILTYCNAGPLATSRYGTALGPILLAHERGMDLHVYCCETRPLLQGARLTAYELSKAGVDCTLICDNMASIVMSEGKINAVFVGADRVARNGDAANKIGTSGVAILAHYYGIPFYVCCPSSTIDPDCMTGADIEIELRDSAEIKELHYAKPMALAEINCYNPAFDVTDNSLITAIITEKGVHHQPYCFRE